VPPLLLFQTALLSIIPSLRPLGTTAAPDLQVHPVSQKTKRGVVSVQMGAKVEEYDQQFGFRDWEGVSKNLQPYLQGKKSGCCGRYWLW